MVSKIIRIIRHHLPSKILFFVLLFSLVLTFTFSGIQMYIEFKKDVENIHQNLQSIKKNSLNPISLSLYNYSMVQLKSQLQSMLYLRGIKYLEVVGKYGQTVSVGQKDTGHKRSILKEMNLEYSNLSGTVIQLGKLTVLASFDNAYETIIDKFKLILIANFIQSLITIVFLMGVFQILVTNHIKRISDYASGTDMEKLDIPLKLNKNNFLFFKEDELDRMAGMINRMRERLLKDVSRRKDYAAKLALSENRFKQLANATREAIVIHDTGRILQANDQYYKMFGYAPEELIGINAIDRTIHPTHNEYLKKMIAERDLGPYEVIAIKKDGNQFPVEIWVSFMEYDGEEVRVASLRDVSEYKKTQAQIVHLQNYLRNIIDSMPSLIVGVDKFGIINEWNLEAEKFLRASAADALGENLEDIFISIGIDVVALKNAITGGKIEKFSRVHSMRQDKECFLDITVYPLAAGFEGAVIRVDDITEKVRMEEIIIQSEKMLSVGGLAAGMAHEINNPLAGILQSLQVAQNRLKGGLQKNVDIARECGVPMETIEKYVQKRQIVKLMNSAFDSGRRAAAIVRDMLSFSRKSESDFASHDIRTLLDKTIELSAQEYSLKKRYDFKQVKINKDYHTVPNVFCDENKIQLVFLNIMKNGAQIMAAKTYEKDEGPTFFLRVFQKENTIRVEIEDTGPGMDELIRIKVFEPFFTTKKVGSGTGLGLSVSYFIITENHKGKMGVISPPGKGATFYIELPKERTA